MRILSKYKDYYDYLSHSEIADDEILFDRRKADNLVKSKDMSYNKSDEFSYVNEVVVRHGECLLYLYAGYQIFVFFINVTHRDDNVFLVPPYEDTEKKKLSYTIELVHSFKNYNRNISDKVLEMGSVDTGLPIWWSKHWKLGKSHDEEQKQRVINFIKDEKIDQWKLIPIGYDKYHEQYNWPGYPILTNTFVSKLIPAEEIYRNIEDFLFAARNDKDQESEGLTDVDKAINHGFDKKNSFRNVK